MKILITNDDGVFAPGIKALWLALSEIADIYVVAPDSEKSAMSQAITVHHPIRVDSIVTEDDIKIWKVGGTPTDCVKLALETLLPVKPDIVVSGINHGPNLGTDVLYSGTVSAAIEGALHGLPAIAVSLDSFTKPNFSDAANFIKEMIPKVISNKLPPNTVLNVNIPNLPRENWEGTTITKLGVRAYENVFEKRTDPRGRTYYWMGGTIINHPGGENSDIDAIMQKKISITPIHFDLTHYNIMLEIKAWGI